MLPFIDIHTHHPSNDEAVISLQNFIVGKDVSLPQGLFTAGIHPWFVDEVDHQKSMLLQLAKRQECLAIGECGLDGLKGQEMDLQEQLFIWHIHLSEELRKPLIIHCVKAFELLLKLHKDTKPVMPWIIHGFQGKSELAKQLVGKGLNLSYGAAVLNQKRDALRASLKHMPIHQLFLESDESTDTIQKIYQEAADLKDLALDDLKNAIYSNYVNVFSLK